MIFFRKYFVGLIKSLYLCGPVNGIRSTGSVFEIEIRVTEKTLHFFKKHLVGNKKSFTFAHANTVNAQRQRRVAV